MASPNLPKIFSKVAFNGDPFDSSVSPTWTDLSGRTLRINNATRGRQYELDTNQAGSASVDWLDIDEALNPANASSPYYPNVTPYRRAYLGVKWPAVGTGNYWNLAYDGKDPTFESYATGALPSWLFTSTAAGAQVTAASAFQGTKSITWTTANTGGFNGVGFDFEAIPGEQYTASVYMRQTAANSTLILINGIAFGASNTTTGSYVRLTVTFTARWPKMTCYVGSFTTTLVGTVNIDAFQLEDGAAATAFTTAGPMARSIWTTGYVERWPKTWDADSTGFQGMSPASLVGPLAVLQNAYLDSEIRGAVMALKPDFFWPLQEPANATSFGEASGNSQPPLTQRNGQYGSVATFESGVETNSLGDVGGVGVHVTGDGNANSGSSVLQTGLPGTPTVALGGTPPFSITLNITLKYAYNATGTIGYMFWLTDSGSVNRQVRLYWLDVSGSKKIIFQVDSTPGGSASVTVGDNWFANDVPHVFTAVATFTSTTCQVFLYVDGTLQGSSAPVSTTGWAMPFTLRWVQLMGAQDSTGFTLGGLIDGTYAYAAIWQRALSASEILSLGIANFGVIGELANDRISRYLSHIGYSDPTTLTGGVSTLDSSQVQQGDDAQSTVVYVANSDFGNLYEGRIGLAFQGRNARYLTTTSTYTFGENTAGGEYPYLGDVNFDTDPTLVFNIADVERIPGGIKAHDEDTTSQKKYGKKGFSRQINVESDAVTVDAANYVVGIRKTPLQRIASITFDLGAAGPNSTLWPMILNLEIGTRVTIVKRAKAGNSGAGLTMSADYFVESIAHAGIDLETGTWTVTLQLSPASAQVWILDDLTWSVLDQTTRLAF